MQSKFEPLKLIVKPSMMQDAKNYVSEQVQLIEMEIDDSWTRDSGPNFLVNDSGSIAGSTSEFNAWGNKFEPYDQGLMGIFNDEC